MVSTISEGYRKARRYHNCDAWGVYLCDAKFYVEDIKICNGISKGDSYHFQNNKDGGDFYCFKTCKQCEQEAKKHNIPLYDI